MLQKIHEKATGIVAIIFLGAIAVVFVFWGVDFQSSVGNFAAKVKRIEEFDAAVPRINALNPDVFIVTGDHSTPSMLKSHSWHPVPTILSAKYCRTDGVQTFGESECLRGGLGQFEAKHLMTLALANAGRLGKYGA